MILQTNLMASDFNVVHGTWKKSRSIFELLSRKIIQKYKIMIAN